MSVPKTALPPNIVRRMRAYLLHVPGRLVLVHRVPPTGYVLMRRPVPFAGAGIVVDDVSTPPLPARATRSHMRLRA